MKSIIKEVISMTLIAIAMVIILILVFYDYLNINTEESEEVIEYSRDAEVSNALDDDASQTNQVIVSLSKSMYSLNSDDVSEYISEGIIDRSKKHPFSDINSNTYNGGQTESSSSTSSTSTSGSSDDSDYNSGSSNNNSSNSNNSSTDNENNNSSGTSQKNDKEDEDDKDDEEPFFDKGTTK